MRAALIAPGLAKISLMRQGYNGIFERPVRELETQLSASHFFPHSVVKVRLQAYRAMEAPPIEHKPPSCSIERVNRKARMPGKGIFRGKAERLALRLFIYKAGRSTARLANLYHLFYSANVTPCNISIALAVIRTKGVREYTAQFYADNALTCTSVSHRRSQYRARRG
jgi:hypothetical protein